MRSIPYSERYVQLSDVRIHFDLADYSDPWKEPETVLLHHGFARNLEFWRSWVPLLAGDYRVLRYDSRGHGKTTIPPPGAPYTLDQMVDNAVALIQALEIDKVHWVGEASGGIVGMAVALAHPERIASLTLCNTPFRLPSTTNELFVPEEVQAHGLSYWARKTLHNRLDVDKVAPQWIAWSTEQFDRTPPHIAIAEHKMLEAGDFYSRLHEIRHPVLIMAGDQGKIAPKEQMEQMAAQMPNARLHLFQGYRQGIAFTAPEQCVAQMRAFLAGIPPTEIGRQP
jgi:pimeloyl-ACP methyl ester carboxylesterase